MSYPDSSKCVYFVRNYMKFFPVTLTTHLLYMNVQDKK
nr:MAG TPA: hypothetical protein [Caudoviricetes sp.]